MFITNKSVEHCFNEEIFSETAHIMKQTNKQNLPIHLHYHCTSIANLTNNTYFHNSLTKEHQPLRSLTSKPLIIVTHESQPHYSHNLSNSHNSHHLLPSRAPAAGGRTASVSSQNSLLLRKTTYSDGGRYRCVASDATRTVESDDVDVVVTGE